MSAAAFSGDPHFHVRNPNFKPPAAISFGERESNFNRQSKINRVLKILRGVFARSERRLFDRQSLKGTKIIASGESRRYFLCPFQGRPNREKLIPLIFGNHQSADNHWSTARPFRTWSVALGISDFGLESPTGAEPPETIQKIWRWKCLRASNTVGLKWAQFEETRERNRIGTKAAYSVSQSGSTSRFDQCKDLKIVVDKTHKYQWDVRFRVTGTLSDGRILELVPPTRIYYLGDNDNNSPAVESASCPTSVN